MPRLPTSVAAALAAVVAAAACSGGSSPTEPTTTTVATPSTSSTSSAPTSTAPPVAADLSGLPGRLAVVDGDGNLVTMRPDGSDVVALVEDAGARLQLSQPTWSPDGARLAWTQVDATGDGDPVASVETAAVDGSGRTSAVTPFPVFYILWDPTGQRLAYLHSGVPTLEVGLVDVGAGGDAATTFDTGQPYYFSWSPDGSSLVAHVGADRLDVLDTGGGDPRPLDRPGRFQAPSWGGDGALVYAAAGDGGQRLVRRTGEEGEAAELLAFDGFIWFVPSPDGASVAFQVVSGDGSQGVTAGMRTAQPADAPVGALAIADVATGDVTTLAAEAALAFFWSPGGTLLSLHPDGDRAGWFRWRAWGDDPFTGPAYRPTLTVARDYLPFFDQYAQSISPWAPDGSAFAYAGRHESGSEGIWVQPATPGTDPVRVSDGSLAVWSPVP